MEDERRAATATDGPWLHSLRQVGVEIVRVGYADLHGVARGKDVPIEAIEGVLDSGVGFCEGIMTIDLRHNVVLGFETGLQDVIARIDPDTIVQLPWDRTVAWCLCDLVRTDGSPYGVDPRGALRRAVEACAEVGLSPVIGPELEFYLAQPDPVTGVPKPLVSNTSRVYSVGPLVDPSGLLQRMLRAAVDCDLLAVAAAHEFGSAQYEINLKHSDALDAADRAFRLKSVVKDLAAREGVIATFMGKPFNGDEGSGFHLHVSALDGAGANAFADPAAADGLAPVALQFMAGVLEHAPALSAFLSPTINAYRRFEIHSLAPTHVNWGHDNRLTLARVPEERGMATRIEFRAGDASANPYLAIAGLLQAGLDGIRRELTPPAALGGNPYELDPEEWGPALPSSLPEALDALRADETMVEAIGSELVDVYDAVKRNEIERYNRFVSDWDVTEYMHHL